MTLPHLSPDLSPTRVGKIARLPFNLRFCVNVALLEGIKVRDLAEWVNELPEVKAILKEEWNGRPITEQNVSVWKKGGYKDWLANQRLAAAAADISSDAEELQI